MKCPPCAQIITTPCECGQSNVRTIRCAQNSWQCGKKVCIIEPSILFLGFCEKNNDR